MKRLIFISFLLLTSHIISAQNISMEVSADEVEVGEAFLVTYNIDGNAKDFKLPELKDFKTYESGKSTNVSIINGKMSRSTGYNITFIPLKKGTFDIPPGTAIFKDKEVKSSGFTIKVVENGNKSAFGGGNTTQNNQNPDAPSNNWKENILLIAQADKNQMYVGEQVTITYKLLRRIDYQSMEIDKLPVFNGFLSEEMEIPSDKTEGTMEYKGKKYYYQAFRKVALFATQAGKQTIDPLSARGVILTEDEDPFFGSSSFFGSSFFTNTTPLQVYISSNKLNIQVLPLPEENKPANFSGAVGQFDVSRNILSTQILQDQSSILEINITGNGNIKNIIAPKIQTGSLVDIYDPEIKDDFRKRGDIYGGSRKFTYAIVPKSTGNTTIPEDNFVYFDPKQKQYITKHLPEINLTILPKSVDTHSDSGEAELHTNIKDQLTESKNKSLVPIAISACSVLLLFSLVLIVRKKKKEKNKQKEDIIAWPDMSQYQGKEKYAVLGQSVRENVKKALQTNVISDSELLSQITDHDVREKLSFILHSCDRAAYSPMEVIAVDELEKLAKDIFPGIKKEGENV
ncbi:MAG: BatD family protein [Chitinophagales bacterium]|nr:BatD family protein [Chitinophagales bacterium]